MNAKETRSFSPGYVARLWMEVQPSVFSFICAAVPRFHDAEDVLQEVAVDVADNFQLYDSARPFIAWVIGIARFKIAAHYRRNSQDRCLLSEEMLEHVGRKHISQHDRESEMSEALEECLGRLAPKSRAMIELRYVDDLRSLQLAERLGSTPGSIRVTLARIRKQLLECLRGKQIMEFQ